MHNYGPFSALTDPSELFEELEPAHRAAFEELQADNKDTFAEAYGLMQTCDGSLTMLVEPEHQLVTHCFLIDTTGPGEFELFAMDIPPKDNPLKATTLDEAIDRLEALVDREDAVRGLVSALRQFILSNEEDVSIPHTDRNELVAYLNAMGARYTL